MNILFLVFSFLILFSFFNAALLKNTHFFSQEKNSFCAYLESKQNLQNKWERYKYQTQIKNEKLDSLKNKTGLPTQKKTTFVFSSHRFKENIPSLGKWNLFPVFSADRAHSLFLGECTENLLNELYGHTAFWKKAEEKTPDLAHLFLLSFVEKQKSLESLNSLSDLFPNEIHLQEVFYKMLKGSGIYNIEGKKGHPPLEDFFCLSEKEKSITCIPYASYPILTALFQKSVVEEILSLEKKKWDNDHYHHSVTKEELKELSSELSLCVLGKRFQDLEPFLSFSHKKTKLEKITSQNKKHKIQIKQPIS